MVRCNVFASGLFATLVFVGSVSHAEERIGIPSRPALSPDGKTLAFRYANDVWTAPVAGGEATRFTLHSAYDGEPKFAPDGKSLAFISDRTGSRQVFIKPLGSGRPKQLTDHSEGYQLQDWFPDGNSLLTLANRDHHWRRPLRLFKINAEKRQAEQLLFDAYAADGRISPDGTKILFVREGTHWWRKGYVGSQAAQIWLYNIGKATYSQVLTHPAGSRWPMWRPDGKGFYYVGAESGVFNLRSYDFSTKETKALTHFDEDSVVFPCISRDGSTIAFRHLFDLYRFDVKKGGRPEKIELHDPGDGIIDETIRRSLTSAENVSFTKDGLEMVVAAGGDLWAMDTELREPVPITRTAVEEREPVFIHDGKTVLFLRDENGQIDLYKATPSDATQYWWRNSTFEITRLTSDPATESNIMASPDGKHIGVVKEPGELWVFDLDGKNGKKLVTGFDSPSYDFSPDGKWIAYSHSDNDFNREIWIVPTDGSKPAVNVSRHPDNDYSPVWSSDGRKLAFTGRRSADEVDIYYLFLRAEDDDESSRDRKLKKALDKINKARKKTPPRATPRKTVPTKPEPKASPATDPSKKKAGETPGPIETPTQPKPMATLNLPQVKIDFENIHERVRRISIPNSSERGLFWFGDAKTLAFTSTIAGKSGTYTVEIPDRLTAKQLSAKTGSLFQRLKDVRKVGWLSSGQPGTVSLTGATETFTFRGNQELNRAGRYQAAFDVAWRLMRDNWYDDRFGNHNWDAIRRKYSDAAALSPDATTLGLVVQLMLGELNGSHLGFSPRATSPRSSGSWKPQTAHLGLRFLPSYKGPGLKVRDVFPEGPTDAEGSRIEAGELIVAIDGTTVDPAFDLTQILNGSSERDIVLTVRNKKEEDRQVTIRPISYGLARAKLYDQWLNATRTQVEELSKGQLGYLHIRGMNLSSFLDFERQLYNVGYGKEGLIIDVRENGGGYTTDHLLTALTQPHHAITVPRGGGPGYPHDRMIYATWHKPITVLCNQNSFSNAEIFSHAIKSLRRGQLVGVTTAGGVISTGSARVMDLGTLRQPFRGWFVASTGQDMELNGAKPHHELWPHPGELPAGKDRQLEKAVDVLQQDVTKWLKRPRPKLQKATERARHLK